MRSVAKNRSATSPTKNGDTIAASAVVLYARPLSWPENWSVLSRYVPMVTYQAPQTKYWRNIITDSFNRVAVGICGSSENQRCGVRREQALRTRLGQDLNLQVPERHLIAVVLQGDVPGLF